MKKLPKTIHVRWEEMEQGDEPFLLASDSVDGVMNDDGPFRIGVYQLVEVVETRKVIQVKKAK